MCDADDGREGDGTGPLFRALPPGAVVHVATARSRLWTCNKFLRGEEAEALFVHAKGLPLVRHPVVRLWGKELRMRRSVAFFADDGVDGYRFSNQTMAAQPLTDPLRRVLRGVNDALGTRFNGLLVNLYADGTESIGPHSDSPEGLAEDGSVAALTLGAQRVFRVRPKDGLGGSVDVVTTHGQLLLMEARFQDEFTHEVPVQKKVLGPRVSITFRQHAARGADL